MTEVSDGKSRATRRIDCDGDRVCWMRRAVVRPITPALFACWKCQLSLFLVGGGFVDVLFFGGLGRRGVAHPITTIVSLGMLELSPGRGSKVEWYSKGFIECSWCLRTMLVWEVLVQVSSNDSVIRGR